MSSGKSKKSGGKAPVKKNSAKNISFVDVIKRRDVIIAIAAALLVIVLAVVLGAVCCDKEDHDAVIRLDGNASTGYAWTYEMSEPGIVEEKSSDYTVSGMPGSNGEFVFTFHGVKNGEVTLHFSYERSFEDSEPIRTADYVLLVDNGRVSVKSSTGITDIALVSTSDIVGVWVCTIDCTSGFDGTFEEVLAQEGIEDYDKRVILPWTVTFEPDGVCTYFYDSDTADSTLKTYLDGLAEPLTSYMYKMLESQNGMTKEQVDQLFLSNYNMTLSDYCADLYNQIRFGSGAGTASSVFGDGAVSAGRYKTEDGRLYFAAGDGTYDETSYFRYSVTDNKLVLEEGVGNFSTAFAGLEQYMEMPVSFTRA